MVARTLSKAVDVLGTREAARRWVLSPAMVLDGARPRDLLRTEEGAHAVMEFLMRLEYGVYNWADLPVQIDSRPWPAGRSRRRSAARRGRELVLAARSGPTNLPLKADLQTQDSIAWR
ncbi:antitoxin Xre/MbcA/ParS toxin-binding domain-containing protein [Variovorax sp. LjRoot84]|uniref:antitoxin Xre/MbcA/ParS toxin-binding domain-containing protein n=1 Tax=Variovorax sp. LjRoot84 TaxID=3342340 RepID=UPI003F516A44